MATDMMGIVKDLMQEMSYNRWVARNNEKDPTSLAIKQQETFVNQANQDRMLKERMFKDNLSAQRNIAEIANPMSNLSSSERYLNTKQNLKDANMLSGAGVTKANFENKINSAMEQNILDKSRYSVATAKAGVGKARLENEQSGMMNEYFAQPGNMGRAFNPYGTQNTTTPPPTTNMIASPSGISNYPKIPGIGTPIVEDFIPEDPRTKYFKSAEPQGIFERLRDYNTR